MGPNYNPSEDRAVYTLLGELSADVKHILSALDATKQETARLRDEMKADNEKMKDRLTKVEKFNVRVLTYASIALPPLLAVVNWGVPVLLALL